MRTLFRALLMTLILISAGSIATAQSWRGMGRVAGKVTDESGKPLEGVVVKLVLPGSSGGMEVKTNKKGEWAAGGIARGEWQIDFEFPNYETRRITASVAELTRTPAIETVLKQDEQGVVRVEVEKASALVNQKKWSEARAIYLSLIEKHPNYTRVYPFLAQTYYAEKNYDEAIKYLKIGIEKDPSDQTSKMLLANVLMQTNRLDEGRKVMDTIDDDQIQDPAIFVNIGINLLNNNKADEALPYFEKAIARFPDKGDGYYYRALVRLQKGDTAGTKADLTKFLELSPDAPEAPAARKALEQLK
jgi:tetratricopeptide (TPR) repeat protein